MGAKYYVYQLIDPRTNSPFYIGKGCGNRMYQHQREAMRGSNHPKCKLIREIIADGFLPVCEISKRFNSEDAAYKYEAKLIKKAGRASLTNRTDGGKGVPSWVVSVEITPEEERDMAWISLLAVMSKKTNGFKLQPVLKWAGGEFPISEVRLELFKDRAREVMVRRGIDWVNKAVKPHGVEFVEAA